MSSPAVIDTHTEGVSPDTENTRISRRSATRKKRPLAAAKEIECSIGISVSPTRMKRSHTVRETPATVSCNNTTSDDSAGIDGFTLE